MILLWDNSIYLQYHQKKIPHHTTTYKNSSNYYVKKARSSHLQTKKNRTNFFFFVLPFAKNWAKMPSSSIPPQTHPHVTKGRQVGHFSRPETDDADLVISNLFSLMNFNKYEEAVKLFTWYSADLLFRTLKNSLYLKSIPWTSLSHTVVGNGLRALVLYGGSWSETGCPKILKN